MKTLKSRIYHEPGLIKWDADVPPGAHVRIYILFSVDGQSWTKFGPYESPNGSRINLPGRGKIKIEAALSPGVSGGPTLKKIWLHHYDDIFECGGDAGW